MFQLFHFTSTVRFTDLLHSSQLVDENENLDIKAKYESLLQEFEDYRNRVPLSLNNATITKEKHFISDNKTSNDSANDNGQLHRLKTHNRNLEERIRVLNIELAKKDKEYKHKIDNIQQVKSGFQCNR